MMNLKLIAFLSLIIVSAKAQDPDSILTQMGGTAPASSMLPAFKSTKIVLSHSTETQKKYDLDLRIRHHFGDIGGDYGDSHTLFGLDVASDLYIGLDYGISNSLTIGIGRSNQKELYNLFLKQRVFRQNPSFPISVTLLGQGAIITREEMIKNEFKSSADRTSYFFQALISSKVFDKFSLQFSPGYLLRSVTDDPLDEEGLFTAGLAVRLKITKRMSLISDYQLVNINRSDQLSSAYYNPLGLGLEIETGGHIFSLNFMNSEYILENNFLPETKKSWKDGGVRFGFTISRNFTLHQSKNPDINSKIY